MNRCAGFGSGTHGYRKHGRAALLALCAVLATGCAQLGGPRPAPSPAPPPAGPSAGPSAGAEDRGAEPRDGSAEVGPGSAVPPRSAAASTTLLAQSRSERTAGDHAAAVATLERALRIDPNNAALWIEVGEVELERGNATQAASMARKALTLTAGEAGLTRRAERLLEAAAR
jgi:hypothetical protein